MIDSESAYVVIEGLSPIRNRRGGDAWARHGNIASVYNPVTVLWVVECILAVIGTGGPVKRSHITASVKRRWEN
eukprot:656459-Prorocentrum_minimum.AAC.5